MEGLLWKEITILPQQFGLTRDFAVTIIQVVSID